MKVFVPKVFHYSDYMRVVTLYFSHVIIKTLFV